MSRSRLAAALVFLCLASCAGMPPAEAPKQQQALVKLPMVEGSLTISTTDLTSDGRFAKVRGRVANPHSAAVDGIRYLVRVESRGDEARVLDRFQFETNDRLAPGDNAAMRLDIESMYFSTANQMSIIAVPKNLGGQPVPLPADWK